MDKNEQMAKSILKAVGGTENIKAATHCMKNLILMTYLIILKY